jgi:hypothetical protein
VPLEHFHAPEAFYPLHAKVCGSCFLVQLDTDVAPHGIYTEYAYFSSFSDSWLTHCRMFADEMIERLHLNSNSLAVEVASNDGYLLQYFVARGIPCYGIDPAANVAKVANERGVPTVVAFFGVEIARKMRDERGPANLIMANNVFGHIPDIHDFLGGMKILLAESGTITIEIPHFMRLMQNNQFDTIYHEHYLYHTLLADIKLFERHALRLIDVEELTTHGGSIRMMVAHKDDPRPVSDRVRKLVEKELEYGLDKLATYESFSEQVRETKRKLLSFLIEAKRNGKRVAGYGAPGKGNTLLNYCGIRTDFIDFVVDRNPYKHGKYLPGSRIPIYAPDKLVQEKPDFVIILPWNLQHEIISQMGVVRDWGGQFVVPIPEVTIIA